MSMNHEFRIRELEDKVEALMAHALSIAFSGKVIPKDCYIKRGFQGFHVYSGETKVTDIPLKKAEAEKMVEELNLA